MSVNNYIRRIISKDTFYVKGFRKDYMENKVPIRFFVFTFLWSWLFWGIAVLLSQGNTQDVVFPSFGIEFALMFLGANGPIIGAIISIRTIEGKGSIKKFFKSFLSIKFGWKVWLSIFLVLGLTGIISWIIPEFFGEERVSTFLPSIYIFPIYIIMMIFLGGGQEEIGWRGYIMPYLEKKYGLIIGGLILGIIWAIWHLPLWFVVGSTQKYMSFLGFMIMCIGYSYFFSWVIKESGNRLFSGLVAHGVANAFAALFPYILMVENVKQFRMWIYFILTFTIGILIVITRMCKNRKTST